MWQKINLLNRFAILLLMLGLIVMIIGLILLATVKTNGDSFWGAFVNQNGFDYLKNKGVSYVLSTSGSGAIWTQLQAGVVLSVIITPVLLILSLISFAISFMFKG